MMRATILTLALCLAATGARAAKTLDVYFIDVEGGQATLMVSPSGQSMLVDTGWPGFNGRDAGRIVAAAKNAGVKQIDYLITTHFHTDHVGGISQLVERMPVKNFIDHGESVESSRNAEQLKEAYQKAIASGKRISVKPGDGIPIKGLDVRVVAAHGERIASAMKGAGETNKACEPAHTYPEDKTDNAQSVGFVLQYGKFRLADLGDLTAQKEIALVCPENRIGPVDVYVVTHHGADTSNAKPIVHGLAPRVAIMNNGAKKGGAAASVQTIRSSPRLEDLWQVHFAIAGGKENNAPEPLIANLVENCEGSHLKLSAQQDGSFVVTNARNKYSKTYGARK